MSSGDEGARVPGNPYGLSVLVSFECKSQAFAEDFEHELRSLLEDIRARVVEFEPHCDDEALAIRDSNGNRIGWVIIK